MKTALIGSTIIILPSLLFLMYWQHQAIEKAIIPEIPEQPIIQNTASTENQSLDPTLKWNHLNNYCMKYSEMRQRFYNYCEF